MAKKVYLAAGHGGKDPGAIGNGLKEKDLNLAITLACRDVLVQHGVDVLMSRTTDVEVPWEKEVNGCNSYNPDLAVNIHNNAGKGDGAEVFYHHGGGTGMTLAVNILAEIVELGQNSRGAKIKQLSSGADYYYFIREIAAPSVIVECAFIDHAEDIKIIDTAAEQKAMGIAIAEGILKTLGIACKAPEQKQEAPEQKDTPSKLYRVQVGAYSVRANAEAMVAKQKAAGFDAFIVEA